MINAATVRRLAREHGEASRHDGRSYERDDLFELIPDWFAEELRHVPDAEREDAVVAGVDGFLEGWKA